MPRQPPSPRRPALAVAAALLALAPMAATATGAQGATAAATEGADTLIGGPAGETLQGGGGGDSIRGMEGDDRIFGNGGDDSVGGGPGDDEVRGGRGRDMVNGGQGNDTVAGDRDNDTVAGGPGADRFIFDNLSGSDVITDFNSLDGDRIELPAGMDYTIADTPEGLAIRLGSGGGRLLLAGVKFSAMGTWLAGPPTAATVQPRLAPVADPPRPPHKWLLGLIVALAVAFFGLLGVGLVQLVQGGRERRM